jgi:hypothetical protein
MPTFVLLPIWSITLNVISTPSGVFTVIDSPGLRDNTSTVDSLQPRKDAYRSPCDSQCGTASECQQFRSDEYRFQEFSAPSNGVIVVPVVIGQLAQRRAR